MSAAARRKTPSLSACVLTNDKVLLCRIQLGSDKPEIAVVLSVEETLELVKCLTAAARAAGHSLASTKAVQP